MAASGDNAMFQTQIRHNGLYTSFRNMLKKASEAVHQLLRKIARPAVITMRDRHRPFPKRGVIVGPRSHSPTVGSFSVHEKKWHRLLLVQPRLADGFQGVKQVSYQMLFGANAFRRRILG